MFMFDHGGRINIFLQVLKRFNLHSKFCSMTLIVVLSPLKFIKLVRPNEISEIKEISCPEVSTSAQLIIIYF